MSVVEVPQPAQPGGVAGPREEPADVGTWGGGEGGRKGVLVEINTPSGTLGLGADPW